MKKILNQIHIIQSDITTAKVDCIVNAANERLIKGGGVDHAIHVAAGPSLPIALRKIGVCPTGEAVLTPGFNLQAKWIIHAVGPIWDEFENHMELKRLLSKTYESIFKIAQSRGFQSIAIPNISTGVYGFPKEEAAQIALETTQQFLIQNQSKMKVIFYCYEDDNYSIYQKLLSNLM